MMDRDKEVGTILTVGLLLECYQYNHLKIARSGISEGTRRYS